MIKDNETIDKLDKGGYFDESRLSCTAILGLQVEIMTSKLGFEDSLQNYIVGARISGVEEDWVFDEESSTKFSHTVSV